MDVIRAGAIYMRWIGAPGGWTVQPPVSLDILRGPSNSRHTLPPPICGPAAWRVYDMNTRTDAIAYIETVLRYATLPADLTLLSADLLDRFWPALALPAAVRERWETAWPHLTA